jgi:hypothetical protein
MDRRVEGREVVVLELLARLSSVACSACRFFFLFSGFLGTKT